MIFFSTAVQAAFLSSGLFHFLIVVVPLIIGVTSSLNLYFRLLCASLPLSALICRESFGTARHPRSRRIADREKASGNRSIPPKRPPPSVQLPMQFCRERIR